MKSEEYKENRDNKYFRNRCMKNRFLRDAVIITGLIIAGASGFLLNLFFG